MEKLAFRFVLLGLISTLIAGCDIFRSSTPHTMGADATPEWWDGPRVKPGISLIVSVGTFGAPTLESKNVQVDQSGEITLPLLQEPVQCNGLTLDALKQKLLKAYSTYYRQPQVMVTFAPYDGKGVSPWGTVTVLGEVASPGPVNIPSTMELTVTKVLQMAGGVKPFANRSAIQVSRCDKDGVITRTYVDLKEIGKDGRVDKDMSLRAGDVVWVPEVWY